MADEELGGPTNAACSSAHFGLTNYFVLNHVFPSFSSHTKMATNTMRGESDVPNFVVVPWSGNDAFSVSSSLTSERPSSVDAEHITLKLRPFNPKTDVFDFIEETVANRLTRERMTNNLVIGPSKNYLQLHHPNEENKKNKIGTDFLLTKTKLAVMEKKFKLLSEDERSARYDYNLYDKVETLSNKGENRNKYRFHNRGHKKQEGGCNKNVTELLKIHYICERAKIAQTETPTADDVYEQLWRLSLLEKDLYNTTREYVLRIVTNYFIKCYEFLDFSRTPGLSKSTVCSCKNYYRIRMVIKNNPIGAQLFSKCHTIVIRRLRDPRVVKHLFENAMRYRLLEITENDTVIWQPRIATNFYYGILSRACASVKFTAPKHASN